MARSVCFVADATDAGKRLDVVVGERALYKSRSAAAVAIEAGRVLVGGNISSKKYKVAEGDAVVCELDDEVAMSPLSPEPIPLDVRYEDDDMLVICKPAGMLTHPTPEHRSGTLVNALMSHCGTDNLCNVQADVDADRLGIVHRLDADTSGLMLAAKTDEAGKALMDAIAVKEVDRRYIALVHGRIAPDSGMVDAPITRKPNDRTHMAVADTPSARDAITTFKVLARFESGAHDMGYTLVECKLYTGRTHQIRVHMQYIKHPVVGDPAYTAHAPRDSRAQLGLERQFLHSYKLALSHPITGKPLEFEDHLARDLQSVLDKLCTREYTTTHEGNDWFAKNW
jgi:23S rRNA pseudouridine1911/1915/1917 synthase